MSDRWKLVIATLTAVLAVPLAHAQSTGSPNNANNSTSNKNSGGPAGVTPGSYPLYLSGKVALDTGEPAPLNVAIERACIGSVHKMGYTDATGAFSISLDDDFAAFQDASDDVGGSRNGFAGAPGRGLSGVNNQERQLESCELRAKIAGYSSTSLQLDGSRPVDHPDVGVILLHRIGPAEANLISATTLAAPQTARRSLEKGLELQKKGKREEAATAYQKATEVYPNYAEAWTALGRLQAGRYQDAQARSSFEHAIAADPKFVSAYMGLGLVAYDFHQWEDSRRYTSEVMALDPLHYPQAYLLNAYALLNLSHPEAAEKSIQRAAVLDTQHRYPQIAHVYGLILAVSHKYEAAAEQLRAYLALSPKASDAGSVAAQIQQYERAALPTPPQQ